jgi:purine-binding chemotaxis protein CheW
VTRVPHAPAGLLGLTNLRGGVLPVISFAHLLGRDEPPATAASRIVVTDGASPVGLLVDCIASLGRDANARTVEPKVLITRTFGAMVRRAPPSAPRLVEGDARSGAETQILSLVAFVLAGQEYAVPLDKVATVTRLPDEVTALPRAGEALLGVIPFRGGLLPLVSPHALLGLPADSSGRGRARIVVMMVGAALLGLVVDRITALLHVEASAVDPVPPVFARGPGVARLDAILRLDDGRRLVSVLSPVRMLDDETTARLLAEATPTDAKGEACSMAVEHEADGVERFVVFRLGDEHYGVPIAAVDEVARRPQQLTRVPRAPAYLEGVMNLRGHVIPVLDARRRFGASGTEGSRGRRIVVLTIEGLRAGFAVDAVTEILTVAPAEIAAAPDLTSEGAAVFDRIATVERGGRMVLLIHPKMLLNAAERDLLAALAARAAAKAGAAGLGAFQGP